MHAPKLLLALCLPLLSLGLLPACDSDNGDSSSSSSGGSGGTGGGSAGTAGSSTSATGGGSTGGNSGGACTAGSGGSGGQQCQAYLDCVEQNCGNCNTECAAYLDCNANCACGDESCALDCYNKRTTECSTCQTEQGTCIANNCLDVGCG